jgi:hypothetical protein
MNIVLDKSVEINLKSKTSKSVGEMHMFVTVFLAFEFVLSLVQDGSCSRATTSR